MRREISSEIEKQRQGRSKFLGEQEKRFGVYFVIVGPLKQRCSCNTTSKKNW